MSQTKPIEIEKSETESKVTEEVTDDTEVNAENKTKRGLFGKK